MTDAEWEVFGPQARAVMAELRHGPGGRPMAHRLRVVVDAIRYLVRYGVEWRALPADFPPSCVPRNSARLEILAG